jgi:hypothetical protein
VCPSFTLSYTYSPSAGNTFPISFSGDCLYAQPGTGVAGPDTQLGGTGTITVGWTTWPETSLAAMGSWVSASLNVGGTATTQLNFQALSQWTGVVQPPLISTAGVDVGLTQTQGTLSSGTPGVWLRMCNSTGDPQVEACSAQGTLTGS